jgi:hypothetical protein
LSGRYQISTDGKRLIDGVAFGRPRLKIPRDRPAIDIPPLKRRRITYDAEEAEGEDEDEDEDEDDEPRLLLTEHGEDGRPSRRVRIRVGYDDIDGDGFAGGEEEDADFTDEDADGDTDDGEEDLHVGEDLGESDLDDELRDLQADNEQPQDRETAEPEHLDDTARYAASGQATGLDLETLDKISALRAAFPTTPVDACEKALALHKGSTKSAYFRLQKQHQPVMSLNAVLGHGDSAVSKNNVLEDDAPNDSEAETVASMVKHYDQHGFPSGSILDGTAAAQMVEAMRKSGHPVKPPVHTKFDDGAEGQADQAPTSSEEGSLSENDSDSDHDSESDSGPEVASSKIPKTSGGARLFTGMRDPTSHDDDSESENESGSENDSSSEASDDESDSSDSSGSDASDESSDTDDSDGANENLDGDPDENNDVESSDVSSASSDESDEADSSSDDDSSDGSVDADTGSSSTRKETNTSRPSVSQDNLIPRPPSDTLAVDKNGIAETPAPVPPGQGKTATQKRNARRRAAHIAQIAAARGEQSPPAGGLRVLAAAESRDLLESIATKKAALLQRLGSVQDVLSQQANEAASHNKTRGATPQTPVADNPVPDAFGRQAHEPVRQVEDKPAVQKSSAAWRDKIIYRAVECCQDGVELSEPPFPFVQRWDPQQQYFPGDKNKRGGRSKRKQRNQEEFLDEGGQSSTKRRKYGGDYFGYEGDDDYYNESYAYQEDTTGFEETVLNYDDEPQEIQEQPQQTSSQNIADEDDMPPLPSDVSLLPPLDTGAAVVGMVLTWKQWLLSKATNWQPQVSSLTGAVTEVLDDSTLTVRLAKRDRNLDFNEKIYDDDGNRVYDKFELPGMDDEGEEAAEQGYRTLDLADMIEPRILQLATTEVGPSSSTKQAYSLERERAAPDASQHGGSESPNDRVSVTPEDGKLKGKEVDSRQMDIDTQRGGDQNLIPETPAAPDLLDTSISEDRRHEISLLINDAGFRKNVDPSVTDNGGLDLSSPSRQLEEMSHDATLPMSEFSEDQRQSSPALPSHATSNNLDSQPILLEPFHGFSDATSEAHDGRRVAYPSLDLPPSETASLHSGRQVDPDFSIELGNDSFHDLNGAATISRSTLGRRSDEERDQALESDVDSESGTSDSSLPSLSELWRSTSSSGSKSPSKQAVMSAIKARKSEVPQDLEYEAAMQRLDNSDISEDDTKEHVSKLLAQKLVDRPIEKPTPSKLAQKKGSLKSSSAPHIKLESTSLSPGRAVRANSSKTAPATSSPSVVPGGSQVVSLVSSSPEPELEEHYAEDSIDETYKEPSVPADSGWVKKPRPLRGVSVPASSTARDAAPKRFASSQSKQSADKRPSMALGSLLRAKKKTLSNAF